VENDLALKKIALKRFFSKAHDDVTVENRKKSFFKSGWYGSSEFTNNMLLSE
jgi:hypothetical protein